MNEGMTMKRILVVDDEPHICELLRDTLESAGFECIESKDMYKAYRLIKELDPHLVLLDWKLPGGDGIELLQILRKRQEAKSLPIVMLSANTREDDIIRALDMGASDYVTKPFSPKELLARIRTLLRLTKSRDNRFKYRAGELVLQADSHRVTMGSEELEMTPTQFRLLHFFMAQPERAFSRTEIHKAVWGSKGDTKDRVVDGQIRRLRRLLQASNPEYSRLIQTVRGTGYRFSPRDLSVPTKK